jgi:hypothetical protein
LQRDPEDVPVPQTRSPAAAITGSAPGATASLGKVGVAASGRAEDVDSLQAASNTVVVRTTATIATSRKVRMRNLRRRGQRPPMAEGAGGERMRKPWGGRANGQAGWA